MEPSQILAAQDEYDLMCTPYVQSLPEWIESMQPDEAWNLLSEAVSDLDVEYGDIRRALVAFAREYDNSDGPQPAFQAQATAFMWMVMTKISEIRESEL